MWFASIGLYPPPDEQHTAKPVVDFPSVANHIQSLHIFYNGNLGFIIKKKRASLLLYLFQKCRLLLRTLHI